jgi:diguanylate cyclase (GGDEF)-like protein
MTIAMPSSSRPDAAYPAQPDDRAATIARLTGLLEVTRLVRCRGGLDSLLPAVAATVSEALGFRVVVISVHEPAWDELRVAVVHGSAGARAELLGRRTRPGQWAGLLDPAFEREGCFFLRGSPEWPGGDGGAWHPRDALLVPLRGGDGRLLGTLSVDEPLTLRRPGDEELRVLAALAAHAAQAIEGALETAEADRHRRALEHLLAVSARLTETLAVEPILQAVCDAIRGALAFSHVSVELIDDDAGGRAVPMAAVGWTLEEIAGAEVGRAALERLFAPEFEVEGCYLIPGDAACARLGIDGPGYRTARNGRGPLAWNHHWLGIPLHDRDGRLAGVIWADEPEDRLLPSRDCLKALRAFANQASTAVASAAALAEARFLAEHDPLTRLGNRRAFTRHLRERSYRSARYGEPFALVVLDVDEFKALNDRLGHAAGDDALAAVGEVLRRALRLADRAFRLGGDEFALVLERSGEAEAALVVDRVCERLAALPLADGSTLRASFGAAVGGEATVDPDTLLRAADGAMYEAKRAGARLRCAPGRPRT